MDRQELSAALGSLTAMLVDDDDFALELAEDALRTLGFGTVLRETTAQGALATYDGLEDAPALIVCDLQMPGMDGVQFMRHLASRKVGSAVLVWSSSERRVLGTVQDLARAHGLRFLGALGKPLELEELRRHLERLVASAPRAKSVKMLAPLSPEEIVEGLAAGHLEVFFQPKVAVPTRELLGAECLARWRHPVRGLIPPVAFISVAEQYGLIGALTKAVFAQAALRLGEWNREGYSLKAAVNISMDDLGELALPEQLAEVLEREGVKPEQLVLEITESRLMSDLSRSLEIIMRLRLKGFGLSIDDFGTGYSTLEKLRMLPFTELKVDRAFVGGALKDKASRAILESSVNLGRMMEMQVVAEGVETEDEWSLIAGLGCDQAQGYLLARPTPAAEFAQWTRAHPPPKRDAVKGA